MWRFCEKAVGAACLWCPLSTFSNRHSFSLRSAVHLVVFYPNDKGDDLHTFWQFRG